MKNGECTGRDMALDLQDLVLDPDSAKDSCGFCGQIM